ncbi:hypothetical protein BBJ28_00013987 [Nothophytophthora sp. Chile5]|nr:hypothetical protein BBJ28_00013987 [Nothophytophthora sp. Chile5]
MPGDAGASRTFRSIFGDQPPQQDEDAFGLHKGSDELELEQSGSSASMSADAGAAAAAAMDEDEAMWSDDPPLANESDNNALPGLHFAERRSMEEWADDDDEEENWKDALQDRVNQLELVFQHNNDATAAESRRRFEQQQQAQTQEQEQRATFSRSLPASTRFTTSSGESERLRPASRHKMQRTSSTHACISSPSSSQNHRWHHQHKPVAVATTSAGAQDPSGLRKRSTSTDFVARNIQGVEHHRKRSGSMSMERLVNDAQRLHFLEDLYQHQQRPQFAPSATSSTAVAPPASPSSSAMSTS